MSKITFPDCRLVLAVIIAVVLGGASLARSLGFFRHDMYWLQEGLGGDKVSHLLMGAGIVLVCYLATTARSPLPFIKILLMALCILVLEEFSQIFLATRHFDWLDLTMGILGAVLATAGVYLYSVFASLFRGGVADD